MAYETEIKTRFRDVDAMGHVNNAVYFSFMEQARTEYYLKIAGKRRLDEFEIILASATCNFRSPISWGETVLVRAWPGRIGESSFLLKYEIRVKEDGRLVADGESVQVAYDYRTKKSRPIPSEFRKAIEAEIAQ
ncbi:MAG: thioesterase family protein [Candidatus Thermoplasmatota archaeon]|jgi:acyl-CoA thioester hydrolase